jgi:hypothetical protein
MPEDRYLIRYIYIYIGDAAIAMSTIAAMAGESLQLPSS